MDSINTREDLNEPLKEQINESDSVVENSIIELLNISSNPRYTEAHHTTCGFESDDDYNDLFLFGVGGPA